MKSHPRIVTIALGENVARGVRLEAARKQTSVSRLLAGMLKGRMRSDEGYERATRRAVARKPFLKKDGQCLSREAAHERSGLRGWPRPFMSVLAGQD